MATKALYILPHIYSLIHTLTAVSAIQAWHRTGDWTTNLPVCRQPRLHEPL